MMYHIYQISAFYMYKNNFNNFLYTKSNQEFVIRINFKILFLTYLLLFDVAMWTVECCLAKKESNFHQFGFSSFYFLLFDPRNLAFIIRFWLTTRRPPFAVKPLARIDDGRGQNCPSVFFSWIAPVRLTRVIRWYIR